MSRVRKFDEVKSVAELKKFFKISKESEGFRKIG